MFATKEWLKVTLLFCLGVFIFVSLGNYLQEADATGGRVRQWSVSWTEDRFVRSTDKGMVIKNCPYCAHQRLARRYWVEEEVWKVTINYLDDGESVQSMRSERKLRDKKFNFYLYYDHVGSGSGSQCGG